MCKKKIKKERTYRRKRNVKTFEHLRTVPLTIIVAKIYRPRWLLTIYTLRKFLKKKGKLNGNG